ncbi:hypothetical protein HanRHA438_Chr09g0392431 [Helianthus annuus]|nr:hypothetical protein HanRHA438_Chr09g0392431 [Helianthus annuus]
MSRHREFRTTKVIGLMIWNKREEVEANEVTPMLIDRKRKVGSSVKNPSSFIQQRSING